MDMFQSCDTENGSLHVLKSAYFLTCCDIIDKCVIR